MSDITATALWHPTDQPGQMAALLALLFAPQVGGDDE